MSSPPFLPMTTTSSSLLSLIAQNSRSLHESYDRRTAHFLSRILKGPLIIVKKHRRGAHSGGYLTKRHDVLQQLLRRRSVDDLAVVVHVLPLRLHIDSKLVKQEVCRQIERIADCSDGIFVLYGICDALRTLEHDFNGRTCQLFFLADDDEATVEDCIALALGGNQAYANVLTNDNIMLFLTPMVAAQWQDLSEDFMMMKHARFKKIAKVDTGLSYEPDFDANIDKCAKHFSLYPVLLRGNTNVIQKNYLRAKKGGYAETSFPLTL